MYRYWTFEVSMTININKLHFHWLKIDCWNIYLCNFPPCTQGRHTMSMGQTTGRGGSLSLLSFHTNISPGALSVETLEPTRRSTSIWCYNSHIVCIHQHSSLLWCKSCAGDVSTCLCVHAIHSDNCHAPTLLQSKRGALRFLLINRV